MGKIFLWKNLADMAVVNLRKNLFNPQSSWTKSASQCNLEQLNLSLIRKQSTEETSSYLLLEFLLPFPWLLWSISPVVEAREASVSHWPKLSQRLERRLLQEFPQRGKKKRTSIENWKNKLVPWTVLVG